MLLDFKIFNKWLNESLYIKPKKERDKIIKKYKEIYTKKGTIFDFEKELEKIGWNEITVKSISNYVLYREYRYKENKKKERSKKCINV